MDSISKSRRAYKKDVSLLIEYLVCERLRKSYPIVQVKSGEYTFEKEMQKWTRVPLLVLKTPQQPNGYDCGVYTMRNLKNIIQHLPTSSRFDVSNGFATYIDQCYYGHTDITAERQYLKDVILSLHEQNVQRSEKPSVFHDILEAEVTEKGKDAVSSVQKHLQPLCEKCRQIFFTKDILAIILSFLISPIHNQEDISIEKLLRQESVLYFK